MYQYTFADKLCKACKEKNFSVEELASAINKSTRQVSRYRNGQCKNIPLSTIASISNVLKIKMSDLLPSD